MKTVAILNYKGGVGKTTSTACLAQALALVGYRVLAIDNDYQHNLTIMLGRRSSKPGIRDIYHGSVGTGAAILTESILTTEIENLSLITSSGDLTNDDLRDPFLLQKCIRFAKLGARFDFVLIDNGPGLDRVQQAALHASDLVFVPTELSHFAISGLYEMHRVMATRFPDDPPITGIIPALCRGTKQQAAYLRALEQLFPGKLTRTQIPYDSVFDGLTEQRKVLFLHRLASKAADLYLSLVQELFHLDPAMVRLCIRRKRRDRLNDEATRRLERARLARNRVVTGS